VEHRTLAVFRCTNQGTRNSAYDIELVQHRIVRKGEEKKKKTDARRGGHKTEHEFLFDGGGEVGNIKEEWPAKSQEKNKYAEEVGARGM